MGAKINESAMLKALKDLEDEVEKGDALEEQDTEGGFSTQGTPLSSKSPKGSVSKAEDASSDDESSDDGSEAAKSSKRSSGCGHVFKGERACRACSGKVQKAKDRSSSSSSDSSSEDKASKSLRQRADSSDNLRKGFDASSFLEDLVSNISDTVEDLRKSIDARVSSLQDERRDFDRRLAKAVVKIGKAVEEVGGSLVEQDKALRKILGAPSVPQRRSVIQKSEVEEREFAGADDDPAVGISKSAIADWLFRKSQAGVISESLVMEYEGRGSDLDVLPADIRKALVNDLRA